MEPFRGGGGEAIGGRTAGPANTQDSGAPLDFVGSSGNCADRSNLYCMFIFLFKFLFVATLLTMVGLFVAGALRGGSAQSGINYVRNVFGK